MFSNDIMQLMIFLDNLPREVHDKIIITMQLIIIVLEVITFFYIRHITKDC